VGLASTAHPEQPVPLRWRFEITDPNDGERKAFWQVAPCRVPNNALPGLPPVSAPDGLILFGHGYGRDGFGVHLAWMPLWPNRAPRASDLWYFRGGLGVDRWSRRPGDARALFTTKFSWTSLSVGRIPGQGHWILLYQLSGQIEENRQAGKWNRPIVARIAPTPWEIEGAPVLPIFNPKREHARGAYMAQPPTAPGPPQWPPQNPHPSFAYGAYLLDGYVRWDAAAQTVTFNYLMSTGCPYQVQVMESSIRFEEK
jgi:hypothetical protein